MRKSIFLAICISFIFATNTSHAQIKEDQIVVPNRTNAIEQQDKPYVILISIDGFRHDYFEKYKPQFLNKISEVGVKAEYMIPAFPSVTFPNHYSTVTGLIPPHHGLVGNNMFNPETGERYSLRNKEAVTNPDWYAGVPIWSLAESQSMLSACFYWPGYEAKIAGYLPTYYYPYAEDKGVEERIDQIVNWLEMPAAERPHLITFYMPDVDHAGHRYGPNAYETETSVQYIDGAIQKLTKAVAKTELPVNFVFLSDHGMTELDRENPIRLPEIDAELMDVVVNGSYTSIFVKKSKNIEEVYRYFQSEVTDQYSVYLKSNVPEKYRFSSKEDKHNRIGDIVLIADAPFYFTNRTPIPGSHGYLAEDTPDMNTVFMAWGPDIQIGKQIEGFEIIHVYPLLVELLGLEYEHEIDGDSRLLPKVLKQ